MKTIPVDAIQRILVIKIRALGDAVLMTPLVLNLSHHFPNARIDVLTSREGAAIFEQQQNLTEVFGYPPYGLLNGWKAKIKIWYALLFNKYDLVVCPHASLRTALMAVVTRAPFRLVHNHNGRHYFHTMTPYPPKKIQPAVENDLDCLRSAGLQIVFHETKLVVHDDVRQEVQQFMTRCSIPADARCVGIAPGASKPSRRWPLNRFVSLVERLMEHSYTPIIVLGPQETHMEATFKTLGSGVCCVTGMALPFVTGIIQRCAMLIAHDSGLKHVAAALSVPTVTIWSTGVVTEWHPYPPDGIHRLVIKDVPCRPCGRFVCADHRCIQDISVDDVWNQLTIINDQLPIKKNFL